MHAINLRNIGGKISKFSFTIEELHDRIKRLAIARSCLSPAAQFRDTAIGAPLPILSCRGINRKVENIMIQKEKKTQVIAEYATHEGDTGSPEVQVAILTARINELTRAPAGSQA